MPARLYFDLVNAHETLPDREGIEVDDVAQSKAAAVAMLDELRQEDASTAQEWSGWTLHVTDAAGCILFSLDLDSCVQGADRLGLLMPRPRVGAEPRKHLSEVLPDGFVDCVRQ
jgi:hypothetical protein